MLFINRNNKEPADRELLASFKREGHISDLACKMLFSRGCRSVEDVIAFSNPLTAPLHDPFLFKDMRKAVDVIADNIRNKNNIVIYGDYDVDGTMATSIMCLGIEKVGGNVHYYIPNRHSDGYGLNCEAIDKIIDKFNPSLIITVDCGITAVKEVSYAYSRGVKVIVTDHHNAPAELPICEAIINAKVPGETYPFKELCGAGVAFKLITALCGIEIASKYRDLAALATVADLVPLVGENRTITAMGLDFMNKVMRPGMGALSKYAKTPGQTVTSYMLGFKYGPMINACGRLDDANQSVALMTTRDMTVADKLAEKFNMLNERRKVIEEATVKECLDILKENESAPKGIVMWSDHWDSGVIGIVASRIQEVYNCPVILFAYDAEKNNYHGSCRSIEGINIYDVLCNCSDTILKFGGHSQAAGLTVEADKIDAFKNAFITEMNKCDIELFEKKVYFDTVVDVSNINESMVLFSRSFEPCGFGNASPKFLLKNVSIKGITMRGKMLEHFSCIVYDETGAVDAIAFKMHRPDEFAEYDIVFTPNVVSHKGKTKIQLIIYAMQKSKSSKNIYTLSEDTVYGTRIVDEDLSVLGITDKKLKQFNDAGLFTLNDLISYIPRKYQDFRNDKVIKKIENKEVCSVIAKVLSKKYGEKLVSAKCVDKEGTNFMVCWFNQPYVYSSIQEGETYIFCGQARVLDSGYVQICPTAFDRDIEKLKTMVPVYKKIKGMSQDYLVESIKKALKMIPNTDYLERNIVSQFSILSKYDSMFKLHFPKNDIDVRDAQRRMVFDKLFRFNFILKNKLNDNAFDTCFPVKTNAIWDKIKSLIPYDLTADQDSATKDMFDCMARGKRLNALVQGDVGTGKTIVAFLMMAVAYENGFQSCIIAPTEVLAKQHYEGLLELIEPLGLKVGYLTGGMKAKERKAVLTGIEDGSIPFVVGTHAVIQDSVVFNSLGMVVIDEQHRFGVAQRDKLVNGEKKPHLITMSATPIPRTLSMALYGDHIQVYNIKTKPAGRKPIITIKAESDEQVNQFMLKEIRAGRQCYVVCPLIDESESESMSSVKSVNAEVEAMEKYFAAYPEVKISNVTGKMKSADIAEEIRKFAALESNVLISTTIIEVGVNVPNATVMVIKSSERFGLAQAHQLRGRVGRGDHQSYCILQAAPDDVKADILCATSDGFEIANQDMLLRGAGDYIGTSQTGNNKDVMLMLAEPDLYKEISKLNDEIFADSARFAKYSYLLDE